MDINRLNDGQKRHILISMIYEKDNDFLRTLSVMLRKKGLRPQNDAVAVPMANSFLRKSPKSQAQYAIVRGSGKNWLNYMSDVELLHYYDFQNRVYDMLKNAHITDAETFFSVMTGNKVKFNDYYSVASDCPKFDKKIQISDKDKAEISRIKNSDPNAYRSICNQVLCDTMLKAHNQKTKSKATLLTPSITSKFDIKVSVPSITEQYMKSNTPLTEEEEYWAMLEEEVDMSDLQFVFTVYNEPIFINPKTQEYCFADGRPVTEEYQQYIEAGERDRDDD